MKWTTEQQKAITSRPGDILVSAAAGSGKTAVLVQRIMDMITNPDQPLDVDHILVVTFTRAAASQMKDKLRAKLQSVKDTDSNPLRQDLASRQLVLLPQSHICTIDSFCADVVADYYYLLGLDPSFTVADNNQIVIFQTAVMNQLLKDCYSGQAPINLDGFSALNEMYTTIKSDAGLRDLIMRIYTVSCSYPDPNQWLNQIDQQWSPSNLQDTKWMKLVVGNAQKTASDAVETIKELLVLSESLEKYQETLSQDLAWLTALSKAKDYRDLVQTMALQERWPILGRLGKDDDHELGKTIQNMRNDVKKRINTLKATYFSSDLLQVSKQLEQLKVPMTVLTQLVRLFDQRYTAIKRLNNIADFSDLEHWALQILTTADQSFDEWEDDGFTLPVTPTKAAQQYQKQFEEILIDEYQDSNLVQDFLLRSVSRESCGQPNVFMVGDVKQSIYKFRLARPELFMQKYHSYPSDSTKAHQLVTLSQNFRSRNAEVLSPVNDIFRHLMNEDVGAICYAKDSEDRRNTLNYGAGYPDNTNAESEMELHLLYDQSDDDSDNADTDEEKSLLNNKQQEAILVAKRLIELLHPAKGQPYQVFDRQTNKYRPAVESDVMILLRTMAGGWSDTFVATLQEYGLSAYTDTQSGYFDSPEIRVVLAMLAIIDNPHQDIELAASLSGPWGQMNNEELAQLRLVGGKKKDLYDCLKASTDSKAIRFCNQLQQLRKASLTLSTAELIEQVLELTGYQPYVRAMRDGARRYANIQLLKQRAIEFEKIGCRRLNQFNRYIRQLQDFEIDYGEASVSEQDSCQIRITSIHKSKGLEAPIVILAGTGKRFNNKDGQAKLIIHSELGLGPQAPGNEQETLIHAAMALGLKQDLIGEEIRILYVALTRAAEKLIVTGWLSKGVHSEAEKLLILRRRHIQRVPYADVMGASSELEMLLLSLADHPALDQIYRKLYDNLSSTMIPAAQDIEEAKIQLNLYPIDRSQVLNQQRQPNPASRLNQWQKLVNQPDDPDLKQQIEKQMSYTYPYQADTESQPKITVTELKRAALALENPQQDAIYHTPIPTSFEQLAHPDITAGQQGTLYHQIMEKLDLHNSNAESQLENLTATGFISPAQKQRIDSGRIQSFLDSQIGQRMAKAEKVWREQPFVIKVAATELGSITESQEGMLVQGTIDAFFIEEGQAVIVDYKTDKVTDGETLIERYHTQLDFYGQAVTAITGMTVKEKWIYSFVLGQGFKE